MTTDTPNARRERYMAALTFADPYSLLWHRDDRVRLADAVMAIADTETAAVVRAAADVIKGHDGELLHRIADQKQYGDNAEMAASYRRDGFGPDEITELLRPDTPA